MTSSRTAFESHSNRSCNHRLRGRLPLRTCTCVRCTIRLPCALQVIEIVRKNVRVLCENLPQQADGGGTGRSTLSDSAVATTTTRQSVDDLKLYQIFQRVFSRMLWNGGRGLVDCLGLDQRSVAVSTFNRGTLDRRTMPHNFG